jgi:mRNA interferase MazF
LSVKRGDVVTIAAGTGYVGKPRPAVIVQSDVFDTFFSIIVCPLTSNPFEIPSVRVTIEPSAANGLRKRSWAMVDKMGAVRRDKLGKRVGQLADADMAQLDEGLLVFLGLA